MRVVLVVLLVAWIVVAVACLLAGAVGAGILCLLIATGFYLCERMEDDRATRAAVRR